MVDRLDAAVAGHRVAQHGVVCQRQRDCDAVQREVVEVPHKSRAVRRRRREVMPPVIDRTSSISDVQEEVVHIAGTADVYRSPAHVRQSGRVRDREPPGHGSGTADGDQRHRRSVESVEAQQQRRRVDRLRSDGQHGGEPEQRQEYGQQQLDQRQDAAAPRVDGVLDEHRVEPLKCQRRRAAPSPEPHAENCATQRQVQSAD